MNYRKELLEDVLPFWLDNAIDYKNGGIYTQLDRTGKIFGTDKSVWFQGRALWSFCKAYNVIDKNPAYLKAAECIYGFLPKCTDTDGRMFFTVTEDGRELQKRRYYYSETFAAIGCAEYYKATGDHAIWADAEKYFTVAYECYTGARETAPKINPENSRMKALAPSMIMLSTAQVMRSASKETAPKYQKIADECLDEILHGGYLTEKALLENVSKEGTFVDSPVGRVVNPGHSLEAAWFVMVEGLLSGNEEAIAAAKKIIDITLPLGLNKENGGIISFTDVKGEPPVETDWDVKRWWAQCEAMIALRLAYLQFGDETYLEKCRELEAFCEKYFLDKECGEWYGYLHYDNTLSTTLKGNIFKGPFHIPRFYMIMAILDRDGKIDAYMA